MSIVTVSPLSGGALMTRVTSSVAGVSNYVEKHNWRRDLDIEMIREGVDLFIPLPSESDFQSQPYPAQAGQKITLVHNLRRGDGTAVTFVGTKNTIWRFDPEMGEYVEPYDDEPYVDDYSGAPYVEDPARWTVVGSGFSSSGKRWEAVNVNNHVVFNNKVDLPVVYRLDWSRARPLYELREQGILSVGTVMSHDSILLCGDVTEVASSDIDALLGLESSGSITISQTGRRVSGSVYATMTGGGTGTVTATGAFFTNTGGPLGTGDVGRIIIFSTGQRVRVTGFTSSTVVVVAPIDAATVTAVAANSSFYVTDLYVYGNTNVTAYSLTASAPFFSADMVNTEIAWADGSLRLIKEYISATHVKCDSSIPHAAGIVYYDNPDSYSPYNLTPSNPMVGDIELSSVPDRRQARLLWSDAGDPSSFAVQLPCSSTVGSDMFFCTRVNKSLRIRREISAVGAGLNGGVLSTDSSGEPMVVTASGPGFIQSSVLALNNNTEAYIQPSSSIGSIIGYDDLQDDGSAILRGLTLQDKLIIYKDTSFFVSTYTGSTQQPFIFEPVSDIHGRSLHYRNTLIALDSMNHIYAGRDGLFVFNLTNRIPIIFEKAEVCSDIFFGYATADSTDDIFACDNNVTNEIYFVCPANTSKPVLAYDYQHKTFSTMDMVFTAGCTASPPSDIQVSETESWFVMGNSNGTVLLYGASTGPVSLWSNEKKIFYRRTARPYSSSKTGSYTCRMKWGLTDFGNEMTEKRVTRYVPQLASNQPAAVGCTVNFYIARNQSAGASLAGTRNIANLNTGTLVPCHLLFHNLQDEIVITGYNKPTYFHSRSFDVTGNKDMSNTRR